MNISLQNVDSVSAVLLVQIEKADYQEKVEKALKTLRQKVNMPGFRKGMVPAGLIKKQVWCVCTGRRNRQAPAGKGI